MKNLNYILALLVALTLLAQVSFFKFNLGNTYYIILIVALAILILRGKIYRINILMVWITLASLISILLNDIPTFFQPFQRLFAFIIVMGLVGPLFQSATLQVFRRTLFTVLTIMIVVIVIISFFGITAGLSIMIGRGGFIGLFNHSMILSPMAAISMLVCFSWANATQSKTRNYIFILMAVISLVTCLAAGSRSALLAAISGGLFYFYKMNQEKLTRYARIIILVISVAVFSFPLWESYTARVLEKMAYAEDEGDLIVTRDDLWSTRILEFQKSPIYGVGFASVDTSLSAKVDELEGRLEPGSSWLVVLSMIGLFGFVPFVVLLSRYIKFLYKDKLICKQSALLGAMLIFFMIHMMAEGYVLSAGSGLFLVFWLLLGNIEFYYHKSTLIKSIIK